MAVVVKHAKTSAVADAGNAALVQPSDWNADHVVIDDGGGGGGTTILDGPGAPSNATGAEDDYYVSASERALYGPKSALGYSPAEYVLNPVTPPPLSSSGSSYRIGTTLQVQLNGQVVAARFWRNPASGLVTRRVYLYDVVSQTLLGTTNASVEGAASTGWFNLDFPTPVDVTSGQQLVICFDEPSVIEHFGGASPVVDAGHAIYLNGRYGTYAGGFPVNTQDAITRYADISWRLPSANQWQVAVPGWVQITQAAYDALTPKSANTLYVIVG